MGRLSHLFGIIHLLNPMVPCGTVTHVPTFCDLSTGCRRNTLNSWNKLMTCPVPFPWHIRCSLEGPAESFTGQGTGIMARGTEQDSGVHAKRHGTGGVASVDSRQRVDRCARILRIVLLACKSCPYSSVQNDVRGILLDSLLLKLSDSPPGVTIPLSQRGKI